MNIDQKENKHDSWFHWRSRIILTAYKKQKNTCLIQVGQLCSSLFLHYNIKVQKLTIESTMITSLTEGPHTSLLNKGLLNNLLIHDGADYSFLKLFSLASIVTDTYSFHSFLVPHHVLFFLLVSNKIYLLSAFHIMSFLFIKMNIKRCVPQSQISLAKIPNYNCKCPLGISSQIRCGNTLTSG